MMNYEIKQNGKLKGFTVADRRAEKLFIKYFKINDAADLKRNKISLANYHTIPYLLHDLAQTGKAITFSTKIKEWFKKQGCTIKSDEHNVNYEITL